MQDNYEGGVVRAAVVWDGSPLQGCILNRTRPLSEDPCMMQWLNDGFGAYGEAGARVSSTFRSSVSENEDADIFAFGSPNIEFTGFWLGYSLNAISMPSFS